MAVPGAQYCQPPLQVSGKFFEYRDDGLPILFQNLSPQVRSTTGYTSCIAPTRCCQGEQLRRRGSSQRRSENVRQMADACYGRIMLAGRHLQRACAQGLPKLLSGFDSFPVGIVVWRDDYQFAFEQSFTRVFNTVFLAASQWMRADEVCRRGGLCDGFDNRSFGAANIGYQAAVGHGGKTLLNKTAHALNGSTDDRQVGAVASFIERRSAGVNCAAAYGSLK